MEREGGGKLRVGANGGREKLPRRNGSPHRTGWPVGGTDNLIPDGVEWKTPHADL